MKRTLTLAILMTAACGGPEAPEITRITLDRTNVVIGTDAFAVADIHAPSGDMDKGNLRVHTYSVGTEDGQGSDAEITVPVMGIDPGQTDASVIVDFTLNGGFTSGAFRLEITATSNNGKKSEPASTTFTLGG